MALPERGPALMPSPVLDQGHGDHDIVHGEDQIGGKDDDHLVAEVPPTSLRGAMVNPAHCEGHVPEGGEGVDELEDDHLEPSGVGVPLHVLVPLHVHQHQGQLGPNLFKHLDLQGDRVGGHPIGPGEALPVQVGEKAEEGGHGTHHKGDEQPSEEVGPPPAGGLLRQGGGDHQEVSVYLGGLKLPVKPGVLLGLHGGKVRCVAAPLVHPPRYVGLEGDNEDLRPHNGPQGQDDAGLVVGGAQQVFVYGVMQPVLPPHPAGDSQGPEDEDHHGLE
mmetsp:Transcript_95072/g.217711  ORF Transcript_95072/g.217711 Transcript_95072/m.217711 type:complete len:274 (-) Transcript_95072:319-1140(-)